MRNPVFLKNRVSSLSASGRRQPAGDQPKADASGAPDSEYVYLEGTHGSEIVADIAPQPGDLVITKKKPSSFFGTQLLPYLIDRQVDTLIVTGGSTCNCVRATVFDAPRQAPRSGDVSGRQRRQGR